MPKAKYLILFLLCFSFKEIYSQDIGNFTQFFFNPYTLNPSYAGIDGRGALNLAYRKQWSGIEGSPTIANLSYHTPLKSGLSMGLNVANDKRGVLNNSGLLLTAAYSITLGEDQYIRFGISAGGSWNTVDLDKLKDYTSDPAIAGLLNQSSAVIGNAGISAHLKTFHFGVAMPNLFTPSYVSKDAFNFTEVKPFEALVFHASNRFYFAKNKHMFEPYVVYRMNTGLPSQYEVAGVIHLNHTVWLGGSYKQDFGISALGGIKLNKTFAVGGSYTLKNTGANDITFPTYEIHVSLLGGHKTTKGKKGGTTHASYYSFVDSDIPKKTKAQETNEKYAAAIAKADKAFAAKNYEEAKKDYQEAQKFKPNESYPKTKIADADKHITYQASVKKADSELGVKSYEQALADYETAAATMPNEQYPKDKIAEIKALMAKESQAAETERKYKETIAKADAAFQAKDYQTAKSLYVQAEGIKPNEKYPQDEIKEIERLLALTVVAKEPVKEVVKEPVKEPVKEVVKEPIKETPKEEVKTTPIEEPKPDVGPERTFKYSGGSNPLELAPGNYVIVGAFGSRANAINLAKGLVYTGFNANYGYSPEKNLWYVHVFEESDINKVRTERDKYRKMPKFRDAWLLTIEN